MAHRKWKATKLQPSMLPGPAVPGCSIVSLHFLWAILFPQAVHCIPKKSGNVHISVVQVETAIDEVVDDAVNAILGEEDAEKVVEELKELEEKVIDAAAAATITEETIESAQ